MAQNGSAPWSGQDSQGTCEGVGAGPEQLGGQQESKLVTAGALGTKGKAFFNVQNDVLTSAMLTFMGTEQPIISKQEHTHLFIHSPGACWEAAGWWARCTHLSVLSNMN